MRTRWLAWTLALGSCQSPVTPQQPEFAATTSSSSTSTIEACGLPAPRVVAPDNGAFVSGRVTIKAENIEEPCFIAMSTVLSITTPAGTPVDSRCDNGIPATFTWDTTQVLDGPYLLAAQRACNCRVACAEVSDPVLVLVDNSM